MIKCKYSLVWGLFISSLFLFSSAWSAQLGGAEKKDDEKPPTTTAESLRESIEEFKRRTQEHLDPKKERVVLLGPTGSGKTTLLNYMAERKVLSQRYLGHPMGHRILTVENPLDGSLVGHGLASQTTLPFPAFSRGDTVYWDTPGFFDSAGPVQDIINAYSVHQLFTTPGHVKIVLTLPEDYFQARMTQFVELLRYLTEVFPLSQLQQGLSVVVMRYGRTADVDSRTILETILQDEAKLVLNFTSDVRDLIRYLLDNHEALVSSFPYPTEDGPYPSDHREAIFESILSANFIVNPIAKPQIRAESRILVNSLVGEVHENILKCMQDIASQSILFPCLAITKSNPKFLENRERIIDALRKVKKDLQGLQSLKEDSFLLFAQKIGKLLDPRISNKFSLAFQELQFLMTIKPDVTPRVEAWGQALKPAIMRIEKFEENPIVLYEEASKTGDPIAQYNFGRMCQLGDGFPKNLNLAAKSFLGAANKNHAEAQFLIGLMYLNGIGIDKNPIQAFHWFSKAAEQDHNGAQLNLGTLLFEGEEGVLKDQVAAFQWILKAAEGRFLEAQSIVGKMFLEGWGTPRNEDQAFHWLNEASKGGVLDAKNTLALIFLEDRSSYKDEAKAFSHFQEAAEAEFCLAQYNLGVMYHDGIACDKSDEKALKWFLEAAGKGHADAQNQVGLIYQRSDEISHDESKSIEWFTKAAQQGHKIAQRNLEVIKKIKTLF